MRRNRGGRLVLAGAVAWGSLGCGSVSVTPELPAAPPISQGTVDPSAVVVSASGLDPQVGHIFGLPRRIKFVNQDAVPHAFESVLELGYGRCPEVEAIGTLASGQSVSVTFSSGGVCAFRAQARAEPAFQSLLVLH